VTNGIQALIQEDQSSNVRGSVEQNLQ